MEINAYKDLVNELDSYSGGQFNGPAFCMSAKKLSIGKIVFQNIKDSVSLEETVLYESGSDINLSDIYICEKNSSYTGKILVKIYRENGSVELTNPQLDSISMFSTLITSSLTSYLINKAYTDILYTDSETNINNFNYFQLKLKEINRYNGKFLIGHINIKNCRKLNKIFGPLVTKELIKEYGQKINSLINEEIGETFCHLGSDSFAVIVSESNFESLCAHIENCPIQIQIKEDIISITITARAGFSKCDFLSSSLELFMPEASEALAYTKNNNQNIAIYSEIKPNIDNDSKDYVEMIKSDLDKDKFFVYFQPVVEYSKNPRMIASEALVRWNHDGQILNPVSFIKTAEEAGFISKLDFYVLDKVCQKINQFIDQGLQVVPISCNFSKYNLADLNLANNIISIVDKYGIDHRLINIEFNASAYTDNQEGFISCIKNLKDNGIKVIIDDFGTDLSILQDTSFDFLKIDTSVANSTNPKIKIILNNLIHLCSLLGITVICKGIESEQNMMDQINNGCIYFQTKIYDKPLSEGFFVNRLKNPLY